MGRRCWFTALLVLLAAAVATACGDDGPSTASSGSGDAGSATGSPTVSGDITVFAAASLTDSFTRLGEAFEKANPDAEVTFNFGASSALVQQINEGAPADVFASADAANMKKLTDADNSQGEPEAFASNRLEIITGPGNPEGIETLEDLADPDLIFVTCGPDVPIGRYTAEVFQNAGVTVTPKSYETDVKGIVTKVTLGEADAGIVYATDVKAAGAKAAGVSLPDDVNVIASYPIAVTKESTDLDVSEAFVAFVLSDEGQAILADFGFSEP
jgi:molybdate transport system substrate-binding protein